MRAEVLESSYDILSTDETDGVIDCLVLGLLESCFLRFWTSIYNKHS